MAGEISHESRVHINQSLKLCNNSINRIINVILCYISGYNKVALKRLARICGKATCHMQHLRTTKDTHKMRAYEWRTPWQGIQLGTGVKVNTTTNSRTRTALLSN